MTPFPSMTMVTVYSAKPYVERMRAWLIHPVVVAIIVTGLNALKPVCVDDPYYLIVSAHLSVKITQPYPDEVHWSGKQQPGMDVLCPPALPYWLTIGRLLLGDSEHLLKLWLFPIVVMLTLSLRTLQRAWQLDDRLVPLVAYGGGCLPMINFMLDVPAMACGLAAFALIVQGGLSRAALAGLMLAVAFQTKYTMMTMPVIVGLYCLLQRKWLELIVSMAVAGTLVNGWEWYVLWQQGSSHFWHHLKDHSRKVNFQDKMNMILSHLRHAGFLLIGPMIVILQSQWPSRRHAWVTAAIGIITCLGVTFLPAPWGMRFARVGFHALAVIFVIAFVVVAFRLWRSGDPFNRCLLAWMAIEFAAMVALSPFVAGRRVVPFGFSFALAACRFSRSGGCEPTVEGLHGGFTPTAPTRRSRLWLVGPLIGIALFALDAWDARAEKVVVNKLYTWSQTQPEEIIQYSGSWGFEYYLISNYSSKFRYCYNYLRLVDVPINLPYSTLIVNRRILFPDHGIGDIFVLPLPNNEGGFQRTAPHVSWNVLDHSKYQQISIVTTDDFIQGSTIPTLYGGGYPIVTKPTPRFGVVVLRCIKDHFLEAKP